jgi:glycosyltransferase involved in cell wall biosynthesis
VLSRVGFWHNLAIAAQHARGADLVYASTVYYGLLSRIAGIPVVCRSAGNDLQRPWIAWPYRKASTLVSQPWFEERAYAWFRRRRNPEWLQRLLRESRERLVLESLRANSYVFANSEYTARLIADRGVPASRFEVLPGGVDAARFGSVNREAARQAMGWDADAYWLMTACRLVPKKGLDFLLHALPALHQRFPDTRLAIVGDGPERTSCEQLAVSRGVSHLVRFTGRLPFAEMPAAYAAADAFLLASRDAVSRHGTADIETMGRVLCEANAAGVPVMASRCGGVPSILEDGGNGLLFEPGNEQALLRCYTRLRGDSRFAAMLAHNGRRAAETRFDWSVLVDRHEAVFARVIAERAESGALQWMPSAVRT